jgi:rRNA maturation endonuclease Nob1
MSNNWQWRCLECNRTFKSVRAAERAAMNGCPKCGGVDIDLSLPVTDDPSAALRESKGRD